MGLLISIFVCILFLHQLKKRMNHSKQANSSMCRKSNETMMIIAGANGRGKQSNQLNNSWAMDIDDDGTIYIADTWNHRILQWNKGATFGTTVAGGNNSPGRGNDQLNYPVNVIIDHQNDMLIIADYTNRRVLRWPRRNGQYGQTIISNIKCWGLAMDKYGYLYTSDDEKDEVRRWKIGENQGILVAAGNGKGDRLNQFNQSRYIFFDDNQTIYVSDFFNHRVMKWTKGATEGIIVAGLQRTANSLAQLFYPRGIFVDQMETLYVSDSSNNRVIRWFKGSTQGEVVIDKHRFEKAPNQLFTPAGLFLDQQMNLYVVDSTNDCLQKFFIS